MAVPSLRSLAKQPLDLTRCGDRWLFVASLLHETGFTFSVRNHVYQRPSDPAILLLSEEDALGVADAYEKYCEDTLAGFRPRVYTVLLRNSPRFAARFVATAA